MVCLASLVLDSGGASAPNRAKEWHPWVKNCADTRQEVIAHSDAVKVAVQPHFLFFSPFLSHVISASAGPKEISAFSHEYEFVFYGRRNAMLQWILQLAA